MPSIMIADRDPNERTGMGWLVSSCAIPYKKVLSAGTMAEVFQLMESQTLDVICLELDMIGKGQWERLKLLVEQYKPTVLVTTAEATFERAMQGIELNARDLWIKPQTPEYIRRVLTRCCQERSRRNQLNQEESGAPGVVREVSYQDLFFPRPLQGSTYALMLAQLEDPKRHPELLRFFEDYPFRDKPILLPTSDVIVGVFSVEDPEASALLQQTAKRLLMDWETTGDSPLFLVMYDSQELEQSLYEKYKEASEALSIRFFKGYRQLWVVENQINWATIDPFLTPSEQRLWVDMLHGGDPEELKQWMYKHFSYKEEPFPEPGLLRIRLTSILAQVRRYMKSHGLEQGELEQEYHQVFETILYSPILYRIVVELLLFIQALMDLVQNQRDEVRPDVIEQAIRYMERRYSDSDLRLEDVARHVDRSPAYFSTLFTQKQGVTFRQLLTMLRVKEASRLLMETSLSVGEIAQQTGFVNANYFSKIFKEKTGTTPRLFRNRKKR
ncbi:helix-turn-helix domain-containing protein [uncultured Brevibacillus sp.]|uniref:helix-turn-helix domain-containing protein n=1 Tax=uncultured Brevibacillus sp. TaxID=169970 RepID=UPI0025938013|nr:helix-turn-helix domain-containing protein [uncultured Brevibacillus sp.]